MDVLMHYIALDRTRKKTPTSTPKIAFHDTSFPASLMKQYGRFTQTALKDRGKIKKDINPITVVVRHILNSTTRQVSTNAYKPFALFRVKRISQNPEPTDSAVMTVMLIQAHASDGMERCKEITEASVLSAAKPLSVLVYRDITPA
ncbi:hypothetical protein YC2023_050274 [Brassica napus]|uniref:Ubiquitin-like protease family profile domain-containing protein n=2 Tax=Brassica TaxID=3705 RepID=A0A3P6BZF7_BRAOL|nr:unnamed protein product [Brassica napus]VDD07568.1 unnamed protein product [Brassica oleracea]